MFYGRFYTVSELMGKGTLVATECELSTQNYDLHFVPHALETMALAHLTLKRSLVI